MDTKKIKNFDTLLLYLSENLNWKIETDDIYDIDDITYDFDANDIGLKDEEFAKIVQLKQVRPMTSNQNWGVFFVEFDSKRFEITSLRKILSCFIPKRRNAENHAVWRHKDLQFWCFWGEAEYRTLGVAYFEDKQNGLPQIKMISCAPEVEDFTQINIFENRLKKLSWPQDDSDNEKWHSEWASAFTMNYYQNINDSETLTNALSEQAQNIRNQILSVLKVETSNGYVHLLYDKFRNTLIHDMSESQFADMYAQTVVYGLFSARCMDESQENFSSSEAVKCIPNTNPFLKSLMKECLGSDTNGKLSFDELEIGNVVDILLHMQTAEIIKDFNRQTGGGREDPVIHFYEEFLTAYDKVQKIQRGVFYTPQPVVNFMVRAVDELIKSEFSIPDGIATTKTRTIKVKRKSKRKTNGIYTEKFEPKEIPAIQILDPATGTGTFLRQVIIQIYNNFSKANERLDKEELNKKWSYYVREQLLSRITGFELMMAPYAVAHMKLAMVLKDTGYDFKSDKRLQVFLTNTLEEPRNSSMQMSLWDDPLATESIEANKAKKNVGINIVIGNPPYSGESANKSEYIMKLMEDYKKEPGGVIKLQEKNPKWINDDYVKFIRYAQLIINRANSGILAYICPHGFIDNPTFRGMRWKLMKEFGKIYIIDLHGNAKKKETCPDGSKDENVFDIQQGVSIIFAIKKNINIQHAEIYHTNLYGVRDRKYDLLRRARLSQITFTKCNPIQPHYFFVPKDFSTGSEYLEAEFFDVDKLLQANSVGFVSARDKLCIQNSYDEIINVICEFSEIETEEAREKYNLRKDVRDWKVEWAQDDINSRRKEDGTIDAAFIQKVSYRPFDNRYTYYTGKSKGFQCYPRFEIMQNLLEEGNVALCLNKVIKSGDTYQHCFVSNRPIDACYVSNKTSEITYAFPLFTSINGFRHANINQELIKIFSERIGKPYSEVAETSRLNPYSIFYYVYGFLFSNKYREKYIEFLKVGFPRIRFPKNAEEFDKISTIGEKLVKLHLEMQFDELTNYNDDRSSIYINQVVHDGINKVFVNQEDYFEINKMDWEFKIGCYQILEKWLKERIKSEILQEEIRTYHQLIMIVEQTRNLMRQIDELI